MSYPDNFKKLSGSLVSKLTSIFISFLSFLFLCPQNLTFLHLSFIIS